MTTLRKPFENGGKDNLFFKNIFSNKNQQQMLPILSFHIFAA